MKKIPMANYIKVFLLAVVTVFVVLVLANIYTDKRKYERANDDVMGFLSIIKYEELNEYLVENADGFIYISSSVDASLDSFELKLKEYILSEDLDEYFVYLDSSTFSEDTYNELKKSYFATNVSGVHLGSANLLAVHDGKVTAVLVINTDNFGEVVDFINNHEVVE